MLGWARRFTTIGCDRVWRWYRNPGPPERIVRALYPCTTKALALATPLLIGPQAAPGRFWPGEVAPVPAGEAGPVPAVEGGGAVYAWPGLFWEQPLGEMETGLAAAGSVSPGSAGYVGAASGSQAVTAAETVGSPAPTSVPEPSSLAVLAGAVAAAIVGRAGRKLRRAR